MKGYRKKIPVILFFVCLTFFSPAVLARGSGDLKADIHSKLYCCPCGVSFAECACKEATEIKAYVDALLEVGTEKEEVFYRVAKRFSLNAILDEQLKAELKEILREEAGEERPELVLDFTSHDFGRVNKKQGEITKTFNLFNKGNSTLVIKNLKTSCPCAAVSLKAGQEKTPYFRTGGAPQGWQAKIEPGEFGELELKIDLTHSSVRPGKLLREATILSNDPVYPELKVRLEARVID